MKVAALVALALVLSACGSAKKPDPAIAANTALLDRVPAFCDLLDFLFHDAEFGARDFTLPANADPNRVIDWYVARLQAGGWKVSGKSFNTIRASRAGTSVSVGVRKRTLEIVANA